MPYGLEDLRVLIESRIEKRVSQSQEHILADHGGGVGEVDGRISYRDFIGQVANNQTC